MIEDLEVGKYCQKKTKQRDEARRKAAHHEIDLRTKSKPSKQKYSRKEKHRKDYNA